VYGGAIADREEFDTGDNIVGLPGDGDSVNLSLPDSVDSLGKLGHIAIISLE